MSDTYYIIAEKDKRLPGETNSSVWPKLVAFSFSVRKILLQEGYGHGLMGGTISLSGFDVSQWSEIFKETDSEWFMKNIADGVLEKVTDENDFKDLLIRNGGQLKTIKY